MDLKQARDIAEKLKNHYRAFELLEDVLTELQRAETMTANWTKQKERLSSEIAELEAAKKDLSAEYDEASAETDKKLADLRAKYDAKAAEWSDEYERMKSIKEETLVSIRQKQAGEMEKHIQDLKSIRNEIDTAQRQLEKLRKAISDLRSQVGQI